MVVVAVAGNDDERAARRELLDRRQQSRSVNPVVHTVFALARLTDLDIGAIARALPRLPHGVLPRVAGERGAADEPLLHLQA